MFGPTGNHDDKRPGWQRFPESHGEAGYGRRGAGHGSSRTYEQHPRNIDILGNPRKKGSPSGYSSRPSSGRSSHSWSGTSTAGCGLVLLAGLTLSAAALAGIRIGGGV